ncbi:MAG: hypothetical protein KDC82_05640 [Bacteroidetes bacterium]|nr:hypothetical protein [Bacteroidota bacterium]
MLHSLSLSSSILITKYALAMKFVLSLFLLLCTFLSYAQEDKEPFFEEIYFTDKKGDRIEASVSQDTKYIYMLIKSRNAIGEKAKLTMDEDEEYLYKKQFLLGGSSILFPIKKDLQKFKLYIYKANKKKHVKLREKALGIQAEEDAEE